MRLSWRDKRRIKEERISKNVQLRVKQMRRGNTTKIREMEWRWTTIKRRLIRRETMKQINTCNASKVEEIVKV